VQLWNSLSAKLPLGSRRGARAAEELSTAYKALFTGHGGKPEAEMVLADLANYTGFYRVSGPESSSDERAFSDGMRAAYGRIFRFLRMSEDEVRHLEEAARLEAVTSATEGNF
jgi:hypothetical protein